MFCVIYLPVILKNRARYAQFIKNGVEGSLHCCDCGLKLLLLKEPYGFTEGGENLYYVRSLCKTKDWNGTSHLERTEEYGKNEKLIHDKYGI